MPALLKPTPAVYGKAPDEIDWSVPERQTRAAAEFLAGLDDEDPDANRKPQGWSHPVILARPGRPRPTSGCSSATGSIISVDIAHAIIVDVEPTPARTYDEVASTKTMLDRTEQRFGLKPKRLAADTAYGTSRFLDWLVGHRIVPHIPVRDASERDDGTLSRSDFRWDRRRGVLYLPER